MLQRREDESVTAFTMRRISYDLVCAELEDLAQIFDDIADQPWTGSQVADYLRDRAANHPTFSNGDGDSR